MFVEVVLENGSVSTFNINNISRITKLKDGCFVTFINTDAVKTKTTYEDLLIKISEVSNESNR